jgi:hypothetical protein
MSMFEIRRLKNQAMRNVDALFCLLLIITAEREADAVFRCDTRSPARSLKPIACFSDRCGQCGGHLSMSPNFGNGECTSSQRSCKPPFHNANDFEVKSNMVLFSRARSASRNKAEALSVQTPSENMVNPGQLLQHRKRLAMSSFFFNAWASVANNIQPLL